MNVFKQINTLFFLNFLVEAESKDEKQDKLKFDETHQESHKIQFFTIVKNCHENESRFARISFKRNVTWCL